MLQSFICLTAEKIPIHHGKLGLQSVNRLAFVELPVRPLALYFTIISAKRMQRLDKVVAVFLQRIGQLAFACSGSDWDAHNSKDQT